MDKKYIEENEIEIKYLRNQLNDDELEGFEDYLMENPDVVERLELYDVFDKHVAEVKFVPGNRLSNLFERKTQIFAGLCFALTISFVAIIFTSFERADKDFDLYTVRGESQNDPEFRLTLGQRLWPFESNITLTAHVVGSGLYSEALVEVLNISETRYQTVEVYPIPTVSASGEISLPIRVSQLDSGKYRLVIKQDIKVSNSDEEVEQRDWLFSFSIK